MSENGLTGLPNSWNWITLGQVLDSIEAGKSFKCDERPPRDGEVGVVKVSAVTWGEFDESESKTCTDPDRIESRFFVKPGDFLFSRANTIKLVGTCVIVRAVSRQLMLSDKILRLCFAGVEPKWILYALRTEQGRREIERLATGNQESMRNIGQERIRQIRIPLAPLEEQKRVIAEIEKQLTDLDAGVAALKRVQANLKRYRASVLKAACEGRLVPTEAELARTEGRDYEPADKLLERILEERQASWEGVRGVTTMASSKIPQRKDTRHPVPPAVSLDSAPIPPGWCIASLEQLTSKARPICYGILMPKEHVSDGVLYVKVRDFKNDRIDIGALQRTSPEIAASYARSSLKAGDVLLSIRGTYGRVAEVPTELERGNITQDTARLALSPLLERAYVQIYLRSAYAQRYFKSVARGVAVKGVNIGDVRPAPILLPPLAEQQRIVAEVARQLSNVDEIEVMVRSNLRRAQHLRQSILKRAFEGKLVPQDPNDEPASVLLDRIRQERASPSNKPTPGQMSLDLEKPGKPRAPRRRSAS